MLHQRITAGKCHDVTSTTGVRNSERCVVDANLATLPVGETMYRGPMGDPGRILGDATEPFWCDNHACSLAPALR